MRLLVIDGNSIANRAFFGIKLLTTKDGRYTNAIFGFLNIMLSLLKESQPDEVAVAFDLKAPTFRHKMYEGYKATRHGMPDELAQQMPVLKEILTDLGYRIVTAEGWEADDILGTLAAACEARRDVGYPVIVKPVNLGSSVGISKAADREALGRALDLALSFSAQVLIEQAVSPLREINCAVLGDRDAARASVCEEPAGCDEILSYQDKYLRGGKGKNADGAIAG